MHNPRTCYKCRTDIEWDGGDDRRGVIWNCDECDDYFCEQCFVEKHGAEAYHEMTSADSSSDEILCQYCYGKRIAMQGRINAILERAGSNFRTHDGGFSVVMYVGAMKFIRRSFDSPVQCLEYIGRLEK